MSDNAPPDILDRRRRNRRIGRLYLGLTMLMWAVGGGAGYLLAPNVVAVVAGLMAGWMFTVIVHGVVMAIVLKRE